MFARMLVGSFLIVVLAACATSGGGNAPAQPTPVELTQRLLDSRAAQAPDSVTGWGVDPAAGVVVVTVAGERTVEVDRFLEGVDPATVRVDTGAEPLRPPRPAGG